MSDFFEGVVQKGVRRGTALGYPTINIPLSGSVSGVYAARVKIGEEEYEAAAFADPKRAVLEAYILDFAQDIYGWRVAIHLLKKIRETAHFESDNLLRAAINRDVQEVRAFFKKL